MTHPLPPRDRIRLLQRAESEGLLATHPGSDSPPEHTLSESDLLARFERLLAEGRIPKALLEASEEPTLTDTEEGRPCGAPELGDFPLSRTGRYRPLALLGDGGMGRVFKAYDTQLKRVVALKFLKRVERTSLDRFLQEGRAQAQVQHPHACEIYAVDQAEGQPYLAMRFVDGPTLKAALPWLSLEQKAAILRDVAEALHACHRLGIVHRDLKPTNIMLERTERGWWPFVMDFGLARGHEGEGLTVTGVIVGTPVYCSPEQVQGRPDLDRRSDVYALGATLYEALCGLPPFGAKEGLPQLVRRIVEEDPPSLAGRVPQLPKDLETITAKAMEKDPARRYESARAFAEDLQRFLDGEPVLARKAGLLERTRRRLARNRPLAAALALSGILLAGLVALGVFLSLKAGVQARSAQAFGREAERVESLLFRAYTLPSHDVRAQRRDAEQRLEAIRTEMGRQGRWARPAGHLALGRGYLALDRLPEARQELELAWRASRRRDPEVAYAYGLTLARLYRLEVEQLRGGPLELRKRELDMSHRRPALACLEQARGLGLESSAYLEAVLAFVGDRLPEALQRAREARRQLPWFFEASVLEAEVRMAQAQQALGSGAHEAVETHLSEAGACLATARDLARSAPLPLEREVVRRQMRLHLLEDQGRFREADYAWALEAVAAARRVDPDLWRVCSHASSIHRRWATLQLDRGFDATRPLEAAIQEAERGLALNPSEAQLANDLVTALRYRAEQEVARGRRPGPWLDRAMEVAERALRAPRLRDHLLNNLGNCLALRAGWALDQGRSADADVARAIACFREADALQPWVGHGTSEGALHLAVAHARMERGEDPEPAFAEARQAYLRAERLSAGSYRLELQLAHLHLERALFRAQRGTAAAEDLAAFRHHGARALSLNPRLAPVLAVDTARSCAVEAMGGVPDACARGTRALGPFLGRRDPGGPDPESILEAAADLGEAGARELARRARPFAARLCRARPWSRRAMALAGRLAQVG